MHCTPVLKRRYLWGERAREGKIYSIFRMQMILHTHTPLCEHVTDDAVIVSYLVCCPQINWITVCGAVSHKKQSHYTNTKYSMFKPFNRYSVSLFGVRCCWAISGIYSYRTRRNRKKKPANRTLIILIQRSVVRCDWIVSVWMGRELVLKLADRPNEGSLPFHLFRLFFWFWFAREFHS